MKLFSLEEYVQLYKGKVDFKIDPKYFTEQYDNVNLQQARKLVRLEYYLLNRILNEGMYRYSYDNWLSKEEVSNVKNTFHENLKYVCLTDINEDPFLSEINAIRRCRTKVKKLKIMEYRYGLDDIPHSLNETGAEYSISPTQVQQIERISLIFSHCYSAHKKGYDF